MKSIKKIVSVALVGLVMMSCGGSSNKQPENAADFKKIETELKSEFGEDAYYTDLSCVYIKGLGVTTNATVTKDPASLKMGHWENSQGWNQTSEITLEVPEGSEAKDFMFQLGDKINLSKLGDCVAESIKHLKSEKNIENPALSLATVSFPDNGDFAKANYFVQLKPENGGTSFSYTYGLDGTLQNFDY